MQRLIRTVREVSIGWVSALMVVWLAVAFEWCATRVPFEWGFAGTFLLVALLASIAYATGAILLLLAGLFAELRTTFPTRVFLVLGVLAPLLQYVLQNTPGLGDLVARVPWGVTPVVSGVLSAALASLAGSRRNESHHES